MQEPSAAERGVPVLSNRVSWGIGLAALLFFVLFLLGEGVGWQQFLTWLGTSLADAPNALSRVINHYQTLPTEQLLPSLGIGALLGAVVSPFIVLNGHALWRFPAFTTYSWVGTILFIALLLWLEVPFTGAVLLGGLALFAYGYTFAEGAAALRAFNMTCIRSAAARPLLVRSALLGGIVGALGSQMLVLPTQHCSFASDIDDGQAQLGIVLTVVGAVIALFPLWTWLRGGLGQQAFTAGYFRSRWLPYILLAPMVINLLLFLYYPSLQTVTISLFRRRFPLPQERFICLENFITLGRDPIYQNSFATTFLIMLAIVLVSMALALGIALLASQKIKFAMVYRTLLIWPFALSPVVAGAIFLAMFREGQTGLINALIYFFTGETVSWLRDAQLARVTVVFASVWNILGFNILFYITGLQNIPVDLIEAAAIDGANRWQRFWRVVFPLLAPFTFFLLVTNVTYAFYGIYGAIDTLTAGGPPIGAAGSLGGATSVLIYKLYQDGFNPGSPIGLAGAQAVILFVLVASITILQFRAVESRIQYMD